MPSPTTTFDPSDLPASLFLDGYRASVVYGSARVAVVVHFLFNGVEQARVTVWSDESTEQTRGVASRLLPVVVAMCRFLNTADCGHRLVDILAGSITAFRSLPTFAWLAGFAYLASRNNETDVIYDIVGQEQALRVVEDKFMEILTPDSLATWLAEKQVAEEGDTTSDDEEDDDGETG